MSIVKIVTDSACTMISGMDKMLDIHIIPLTVMIHDTIYKDNEQLEGKKFMEMMDSSVSLPKTSQPPIGEFVELYNQLGKDGSEILSIHMTQALSGTVEAARQASHLSSSKVTVVDSDFTDQGLAFQVIQAAKMANQGMNMEKIISEIQHIKENTKLFIGISTLGNLVKGGRISRAKGLFSTFFNIKVVMEFSHTELIPVAKGRGMKTFNNWFEDLTNELSSLPSIRKIGISHAGGLELAYMFKEKLQLLFPDMDIPVLHTNSVIATHTGRGAFAIMYYTD